MTSVLPVPEAPGPNPGQPGHYAHHDWLTASVKALDNAAQSALPPGIVTPYAGPAAPTGYLLCEGQLVGRGQYADLFAAIGTAYGIGDGSTTFGIPDLRQRVPVGKSVTVPEVDTLGDVGGEAVHTLTHAEMPHHGHGNATGGFNANHTHQIGLQSGGRSAAHTHNVPAGGATSRSSATPHANTMIPGQGPTVSTTESADHSHHTAGGTGWASSDHAHGISPEGGGAAANNMQPFVVLNYIIKT